MKILNSTFLLTALITSCSNYENKEYYEVKIGDEIEIYASTNSCCFYCFNDDTNLAHTEFKEIKRVDNGPSDCEGCNWTDAYVFEAKSEGSDTIILEHRVMIDSCNSLNSGEKEQYIIKVK